jgi:hypothetical protein
MKKRNGHEALPVLRGNPLPTKYDELKIAFQPRSKHQEIAGMLKLLWDKDEELRRYVQTISNDDAAEGSWRTDKDFLGKKLQLGGRQFQGYYWLREATAHEIALEFRRYTKTKAPQLDRNFRLVEAIEMAKLEGGNGNEPPIVPDQGHEPGTA